MRRLVAVCALFAVLAAPPGLAGQTREQPAKGAALSLLALDEGLAARQAAADRIKAALPGAAAAVVDADRSLAAADGQLAVDRRRLGRWLNFFYRYGDVSLLAVVLGAKSFDDFVNRLTYATALVEDQAALWRRAGEQEAACARTAARLADREKTLRQEEAGLAAQVAALRAAQKERAAFVASLERQSPAGARQVLAEEAGWVASLRPLTRVLHDLSGLPWTEMKPDSVSWGLTGVTLGFDDATLTRVLDGDPAAAGLNLQFSAGADGVVISGDRGGVPFALRARLAVAGPRTVRLVPEELDLSGLPAPDAVLQAVTGGNLVFDLPGGQSLWKLSAVNTGSHRTDFVFGP